MQLRKGIFRTRIKKKKKERERERDKKTTKEKSGESIGGGAKYAEDKSGGKQSRVQSKESNRWNCSSKRPGPCKCTSSNRYTRATYILYLVEGAQTTPVPPTETREFTWKSRLSIDFVPSRTCLTCRLYLTRLNV